MVVDVNRVDLFPNRKPDEAQGETLDVITEAFKSIALNLDGLLSEGRCKALAFTKLEEASMWAKKSVLFDNR